MWLELNSFNLYLILILFIIQRIDTFDLNHRYLRNEELSDEEIREIFPKGTVPEYSFFNPTFEYDEDNHRKRRRRKRNLLNTDPTRLKFNALGNQFNFRVTRNHDILSPQFAYLERNENQSYLISPDDNGNWEQSSRVFTGEDGDYSIAILLDEYMYGVIKGRNEDFIIRDVPPNLLKKRIRRSVLTFPSSHIIYKRTKTKPCPIEDNEEYLETSYLQEREQDYLYQRYDRDRDNGYHRSTPSSSINAFQNTLRYRNTEDLYIETAVFIDQDLFRYMSLHFPSNTRQQIFQFVLAMVNAVQILYNDKTLGHRIKFVLKRLEILYGDPVGLERTYNIDEFLTNFCTWQRNENPISDSNPLHWDHALILTGLDLYTYTKAGKINSLVVGLAPVSGMCLPSNSCTVNEGRHFESVYVVTHEIGHNLGMRHDGLQAGNNCDAGRYLMSPTLGSGKITWSHCSRMFLDKFLETPQAECLRDKATPESYHLNHEWGQLPGQRFTADMQCALKHGKGSYYAYETQSLSDVCEDLHCKKEHYSWTSHPALEGTTCGRSKWCRRGECVYRSDDDDKFTSNIHSDASENIHSLRPTANNDYDFIKPNFQGEWGPWGPCESSCLYGIDGLLSSGSTGLSTSKRQCRNCDVNYRYRACLPLQFCSEMEHQTLQTYADKVCSRLAFDQIQLTGRAPIMKHRDPFRCDIRCLESNGKVLTTKESFPDGTVCDSPTKYPAYCIQGLCTEFRCEPKALYGADPNTCRPDLGLPDPHKPLGPNRFPTSTAQPNPTPQSSSHLNSLQPPSLSSDGLSTRDKWSPWEATSNCKSSCIEEAKGIQLVSRECLGDSCEGLNKNIQICPQDKQGCDKMQSSFQYATEICLKYQLDVNQLSGVGMQLAKTSDDPDRPCTVACQDASLHYRFYRVNGRGGWFPFGTECTQDGSKLKSYCLNGKCLEFEDDGTPLRDAFPSSDNDRSSRSRSFDILKPGINLGTFTQIPEDFYNIGTSIDHQLPETRNFAPKVWKRSVIGSSHRLPGSFDDEFLLQLIREWNLTVTLNNTSDLDELNSTFIDFENPLFVDVISNLTTDLPLSERLINEKDAQLGQWKVIITPCSVTCGEGLEEVIVLCVTNQRITRALDYSSSSDQLSNPIKCKGNPPMEEGFRSCRAKELCPTEETKSNINDGNRVTSASLFEKWLLEKIGKI